MTSRVYSIALVLTALFGVLLFVAINYAANDFGLWRHRDAARIWELEKSTKYLMARRYIPENFDTVLIGPSVSDNLDTRQIEGRKIYNLSMAGGNMTEIAAAAHEYIRAEATPGAFIICLYPYTTMNSGMKSFQIHEKEYYGSLFSLLPVTIWVRKIQHALGMMHEGYEESEWGWHNYNVRYTDKKFAPYKQAMIEAADKLRAMDDPEYPPEQLARMIDPQALRELDELLKAARTKGFKIYAFFYPVNGWAMERMKLTGEWDYYKAEMEKLFQPDDVLTDFNAPVYDSLRWDEEAYVDAHLSLKGASALLGHIGEMLNE